MNAPFETLAGQHPPLSCRTSPPQGGRSDAAIAFANLPRFGEGAGGKAANLPPRGGDVRQDRGGRRRAKALQNCGGIDA